MIKVRYYSCIVNPNNLSVTAPSLRLWGVSNCVLCVKLSED